MLLIGQTTVRRQWILDPAKARNHRLLAVQQFDQDLRMIRDAVLQGTDSVKFEHGVAALLFMLGFSPSVQLETNAPDLIVATPLGRLVIVECTTRISDFASKIGKLVDRRGALQKSFARSGHPTDVIAALVCRLPRDQIAAQPADVLAHNVLLFSQEDLSSAFDRVRIPQDPDQMVRTMLEQNKVSSR